MKRTFYFLLITTLCILPLKAQTEQKATKNILDNMVAAFHANGGIKAGFTLKTAHKNQPPTEFQGTIQVKGEKFLLKTDQVTIWFDGKTQWNYGNHTNEINITTPTPEELQGINPYALLSAYQKGFEYKTGTRTHFQGKSIHEVILTASDKKQDIPSIRLYITKDTYQPVYILMEQQSGHRNEITIVRYQIKQPYDDAVFTFKKEQYPDIEIIDLR
ncbi:Outer-membrane lipoprotein carrier protein [termite gut metagenome]|uniref:Outer-membrane lipoprotein carrier protein n=1 Tax=termite gut metagenome TaxID=433724 RepID=A0A5J4R334_9ZZZZ